MIKYRCVNNPDHVYDKPTDDFWCTQCDISTKPMLEPFEEEAVIVPESSATDSVEQTDSGIAPVVKNDLVIENIEPEDLNPNDTEIDAVPLEVHEDKNPEPVFFYEEASFGDQTWMLNFLNVTEFRNGETILHAKNSKEWQKAKQQRTPAWCYSSVDGKEEKDFGILYNYYAVAHPSGLAPEGWRIPDLNDIQDLIQHAPLDFITNHLDQFHESNIQHRLAMGSYISAENKRVFWSSEKKLVYTAYSFEVNGHSGQIRLKQFDKSAGFFVRCLKEN